MNAALFTWARETAGLDLEAAAKALGIKVGKLEAIEQGDDEPSRPQLLNMAKLYRRPLVTFYMDKPPARGERGEDFRTTSAHLRESLCLPAWPGRRRRHLRAADGQPGDAPQCDCRRDVPGFCHRRPLRAICRHQRPGRPHGMVIYAAA